MLFEQINQNLSIQRFQAVYNYLDFRAAFEKKKSDKMQFADMEFTREKQEGSWIIWLNSVNQIASIISIK